MTTNPCYLVPCVCGRELAAEPGHAGSVVACPWCQAAIEVPRLTRLRELPLVAGLVEERRPLQFGLRHLFALVTYIALALACGKYLGFVETVGMCLFAVFWGLAYAIKPQPVAYVTVLGTLLLIICNLVVCSVQQSRESARMMWTMNKLKAIGMEYQERKTYWPEPVGSGAAVREEFESYVNSRLNLPPGRN